MSEKEANQKELRARMYIERAGKYLNKITLGEKLDLFGYSELYDTLQSLKESKPDNVVWNDKFKETHKKYTDRLKEIRKDNSLDRALTDKEYREFEEFLYILINDWVWFSKSEEKE
jgi:hypothetical protein